MAKVEKWLNFNIVQFGKDKVWDSCRIDSAIMDSDVQCFHCGKNIKTGKLVFCYYSKYLSPYESGGSDWGNRKVTCCSSNHAKLYAKNKNGQ